MFHSYFLSILSWDFTFWSNLSILFSIPDTPFPTCSTLFAKLSNEGGEEGEGEGGGRGKK
jgi:hypothetical protein